MAAGPGLSKAKTILLAVQLATDCKFAALQSLIFGSPRTLSRDVVLRIVLKFVPESTDPSKYVPVLQSLLTGESDHAEDYSDDISHIDELAEAEARHRVKKLRLPALSDSSQSLSESDAFTAFLIRRAHLIDAQTGLLSLSFQLVQPFSDRSETLQGWLISALLPLLRLNYEYYPGRSSTLSLAEFEQLGGEEGVGHLLSPARDQEDLPIGDGSVGRDLRGIVGPWMYGGNRNKRRKLEDSASSRLDNTLQESTLQEPQAFVEAGLDRSRSWQQVFNWLVSAASTDFTFCVEAIEQWGGPGDVDLGGYDTGDANAQGADDERTLKEQYVRTAFAIAYLAPDASLDTLAGAHKILAKIAALLNVPVPRDLDSSVTSLEDVRVDISSQLESSRSIIAPESLLNPENPLTIPDANSLSFLNATILSAFVFARLGHEISFKKIVQLYFNENADSQGQELQRVIRNVPNASRGDEAYWRQLRAEIKWLWNWNFPKGASKRSNSGNQGLFGNLDEDFVEKELLRAFLVHSHCDLAISTYLAPQRQRRFLAPEDIERVVYDCAMNFYDNATNCNRTRGGTKKASDIIKAFYPSQFPDSAALQHSERLLVATHALSFYSLTLHHGVPFQPVNIRIHQDAILLLGKVLEQNSDAYTRLDDLLDIGRNLVDAGLIRPRAEKTFDEATSEERGQLHGHTRRRIVGMAIESALSEDDFETAYSYTLTRFDDATTDASESNLTGLHEQDDIAWRAAFQAGRYKSVRPTKQSATNANPDIRRLEMRMELLAQALNLAPAAALPEILGVWRRCEEELNLLVSQETEKEDEWDDKGDQRIPGQFMTSAPAAASARRGGRTTAYEDAPMGLFDVARGAAAALSKSAFPLRGNGGTSTARGAGGPSLAKTSSSASLEADGADAFDAGEAGRVRKRDVVSNMVTGGLASGIGWVLGANPVQPDQGGRE